MGVFHTICTLLSILGKHFQDAGLRDICIESGEIVEGSVSDGPFDSISECMKPSSKCLIAMHAFTGCDTVNAFAGRGKITALQLVKLQKSYEEMFKQLGMEWVLSNELFQSHQQFTCKLYCSQTGSDNINEWKYRLFCKTKFGIFND